MHISTANTIIKFCSSGLMLMLVLRGEGGQRVGGGWWGGKGSANPYFSLNLRFQSNYTQGAHLSAPFPHFLDFLVEVKRSKDLTFMCKMYKGLLK